MRIFGTQYNSIGPSRKLEALYNRHSKYRCRATMEKAPD
jgi:hypothetical protein